MTEDTSIDDKALDSLSIAPADDESRDVHDPRQEAGQDKSIAERLRKNPESHDAQLDNALDESMDASDPPASTQPGQNSEIPKSSGYDSDEEDRMRADR